MVGVEVVGVDVVARRQLLRQHRPRYQSLPQQHQLRRRQQRLRQPEEVAAQVVVEEALLEQRERRIQQEVPLKLRTM